MLRRSRKILPCRDCRVVQRTIVGYSGLRSHPGTRARKSVSATADSRVAVEAGANPQSATPRGVVEAPPADVAVDSRFSLIRRAIDGAWLVQERLEECLPSGLTVERRFVRGMPRRLEEALDWLAAAGVDRALLLQIRTRLTPEENRMRLVALRTA